MDKKTKDALFDRLNVNAYYYFDFDVPYYLVQGIATYLEGKEVKWRDVLSLIKLAEQEHRITPDQAQFLKERFHRTEKRSEK